MKKRKNYFISLVMVFVFLVSLFPVTNVEAADKYGKVKHKNNLDDISEISTYNEGGLLLRENKLGKGYTDIYEMNVEKMVFLYIDITALDESAFECAITNNKGKIIYEKKIKSRSGYVFRELKKGKYYFKIRALKNSEYQLVINPSDTYNDGTPVIRMREYCLDNDNQYLTIKSPKGKVDWKLYYDKNCKKIKNVNSVQIDNKVRRVEMMVGKVIIKYPIINLDDEEEPNGFISKRLVMTGLAAPIYKKGEFSGKYKYSLHYNYINLSNKIVKNIRFQVYGIKDEIIEQQYVKPYEKTEYWQSAFKVKNANQNILTKVTVEYMDGSMEVIFEGRQSVPVDYFPVMYG